MATRLGLGPGSELNELHDAILRRDPSLAAPSPTGTEAVRPADPPTPAQLPPVTSGFTGRAVELGRLDAWLDEAEQDRHGVLVVRISGTAGIGKPNPGLWHTDSDPPKSTSTPPSAG